MSKVSVFFIVLLMAVTMIAGAEEAPYALTYREALNMVRDVNQTIGAVSEQPVDSSTEEIVQFCQYQLALTEAGLTMITPEELLLEDVDLFAEDTPAVNEDVEVLYAVGPVFVEELGVGQCYQLYRKGNYVRIESTIYDAELSEQLEFIRIEVAERPDTAETMILLTRLSNEGVLTSSNRYLVCADAAGVKSIFRRTFASDLDYRIEVSKWAVGEDFTWDERLLYPR